MNAKKLLILVVSLVLVFGTAGLVAAADETKKSDEKKMEKAPAAAKPKSADGMVKAASPDSVTVVGKDNKEWTFSVDAKTAIKKAGKAVTAADLKEGDPVRVQFAEAGGKMMAKSIMVQVKKAEKKAENPCAAKAKNPCAAKKQ